MRSPWPLLDQLLYIALQKGDHLGAHLLRPLRRDSTSGPTDRLKDDASCFK
jgi:hypothetical protein